MEPIVYTYDEAYQASLEYFKGDELAEQAQALANRAYEEAAQRLPGSLRELEFTIRMGIFMKRLPTICIGVSLMKLLV